MTDKKNIYAKLAEARKAFHKLDLKKTGYNTFQKTKYFELGDFLIPGMDCMRDAGLVPIVSFTAALATMEIRTIDGEPGEYIMIGSPMAEANLKGCHPIQNMGAVESYQIRYLWIAALQVVEHDAIENDGPVEATMPRVSDEQAATLRDELEAVEGDEAAFCKYMKVNSLESLAASVYDTALANIKRKAKS